MRKLLLLISIIPVFAFSQFLPLDISGNDVKQCEDGGYIIAGTNGLDATLVRTDKYGSVLWDKKFNGGSQSVDRKVIPNSLQICADGGFIIAGEFKKDGSNSDAFLIKTDNNGNKLWMKSYGGIGDDVATSLKICSDNGFIVAGSTYTFHPLSYLFKTDRNGNLIWEKKLNINYSLHYINSIQICSDNSLIATGPKGYKNRYGQYVYDNYFVLKTDAHGNILWNNVGSGKPANFSTPSVHTTSDDGFMINTGIKLIGYDKNGNFNKKSYYLSKDNLSINSFQICSDGFIILATESRKMSLYKTNLDGKIVWNKYFDSFDIHSNGIQNASAVEICSDSGYVLTGYKTIKTDAHGNIFEATLTDRITTSVEEKINIWQAKGEFEKTSDYKIRVTQASRDKKIKEIQEEVLDVFKKQYKEKVSFETVTLNEYDADNETFLLDPWPLNKFVLSVPIEKAPFFKQNYVPSNFNNLDFAVKDDKFIISHIEFNVGNEVFTYDISENNNYSITTFDYNFDKIEIDINEDVSVSKTSNKSIKVGKSDVDVEIPFNKLKNSHTYALIIGNEDYSSYQTDLSSEVNVDFANNDAAIFKAYCEKTLGIPSKHIKHLNNATGSQMLQGLAWIKNMASVEGGKAELIVYYSGHGLPDEKTKEGYLIPVDVSGNNVTSGLALKKVFKDLNQFPSQKITVYLDACFSGGARNEGLIARKGVKIKPKEETIAGNMVVFASSSGDESSGVYREKQHGYFTYFLLKKLQQTKGSLTYKELADYLEYNVKKETGLSGKIQTPQVNVSSAVAESWESWEF